MSGAHERRSCKTILFQGSRAAEDVLRELDESSTDLAVLHFLDESEYSFGAKDAELYHILANLPAIDRLSVAYTNGPLSGRDLALCLRCSLIFVGPDTQLRTSFGHPGSAAIYAAAACRIGFVACETVLFGSRPASASDALNSSLALAAQNLEEAILRAEIRFPTLVRVAKANLVTWPFPIEASYAFIDRFDQA